MRSPLVVIEQPPVSDLANLVEITEQVLVQHLLSVCTVEAFDVGVLVRLARLDVTDAHSGVLRPRDELSAEEFGRSEEHTSELQSRENLVCRLLLEKKKRV